MERMSFRRLISALCSLSSVAASISVVSLATPALALSANALILFGSTGSDIGEQWYARHGPQLLIAGPRDIER